MSDVTVFDIPAPRLRNSRAADPCCAKCRKRKRNPFAQCPWFALLLAGSIGFVGATPTIGAPMCKPRLAVKSVQLSAMQPPALERRWTATVVADASRCATTAGYFEIGISRMKENSIELEFRQQFIWSSPSVTISVDFAADEAVEGYWIDSVQACPCAK